MPAAQNVPIASADVRTAPGGRGVRHCTGRHRAWLAGVGSRLADRTTLVSSRDRLNLATDDPAGAPGAVAQAGVDPTLEGRALQDALRRAIATRRGSCSWPVDHAGWVVTLHSPEEHDFYGKTLEEALAWCLVWLMAPEIGVGPFRV